MDIEAMERPQSREIPRFSISNLIGLTTFAAILLWLGRLMGPKLSFSCFLAAYAFAPAIAMLATFWLREQSKRVQIFAAGAILILFASTMTCLCGYYYGVQAMPFVLLGTLIEWPGQMAVLLCLRSLA